MDTTVHRPEEGPENRWTDVSVKGTKRLCVCARAQDCARVCGHSAWRCGEW